MKHAPRTLDAWRQRRFRPTTDMFRRLGQEVSANIPDVRSPMEVAEIMGTDNRKVHYESMIALGKLTFLLRESVHANPIDLD